MKSVVSRPIGRLLVHVVPNKEPVLNRAGAGYSATQAIGGDSVIDDATCPLPMRLNAGMLMLDFVISSALGYPFWILAARVFDPADVGLGSAILSAMRLCSLVALVGIGSAIILLLPRREHEPSDVLSAAFTLAVSTSLVISLAFLMIVAVFFKELGALVSTPAYALTFIVLNLIVVVTLTFDSTFIALRRADKIVARSMVQGVVALAVLAVFGLIFRVGGTYSILFAWIGALVASVVLGKLFLRAAMPGHRLRLSATRATTGAMLGVGLPNFALKLAMTLPIHAIPLVVIEVLSPTANAYWRAVWLFGMLVMTVPSACSSALFAEASNHPERIDRSAWQGIQLSLGLGLPMAGAMALVGGWGLSLMGAGYADAGTTALRILVIGIIPQTFIAVYVARQQAARRVLEPTLFGALSSTVSIGGAVAGGALFGLPGIAISWLVAQSLMGSWAAWKIRPVYASRSRLSFANTVTASLARIRGTNVQSEGDS